MPLSDRIEQLEGEITTRVEEALRELRDDVRDRLRAGEEEALRRLDELAERIPRGLLRRQDVEPIAQGAGDEGRREAWGDLLEGLAAIDGSDGQADALDALLAEALRYASRAVLFLTRSEGAEAWGASGWNGVEVAGTRVGWDESDGWERLAEGRGAVRLSGGDCGALCSRLESPLPAEGVLVPLVLRDRVAAALYADRLEGDGALGVEALQLLTWATGQAIESQPFRRRAGTPTLVPADQGEHRLPLWDAPFEPAAEAAEVAEAAEAEEAAAEPVEEPVEEDEPHGAAAGAEKPAADAAAAFEAELAAADFAEPEFGAFAGAGEPAVEEPEADEELAAAGEPEPLEEPEAFAEPEPDEPEPEEPEAFAEPEPGEPEAFAEPEPDEPEAPAAFGATQEVSSYLPEVEPPPAPGPVWEEAAGGEEEPGEFESWEEPHAAGEEREPTTAAAGEPDAYSEFGFEEPPAEAWGEPPADTGRETVEEPGEPDEAYAEPEPEPEEEDAAEPAAGAPSPTVAIDPGATVFIDRSRLGLPSQQPPPPAESEDEPGEVTTVGRPRGGALVTPPEDVIGPGWAFARGPASTGDDQAHEGARRLARLLVSEIRLYNEDQVEEGRRHNDIYSRLRDDIDRSRQMYEERVDPAVVGSADYFREELVRILAAGDAEALGMES